MNLYQETSKQGLSSEKPFIGLQFHMFIQFQLAVTCSGTLIVSSTLKTCSSWVGFIQDVSTGLYLLPANNAMLLIIDLEPTDNSCTLF